MIKFGRRDGDTSFYNLPRHSDADNVGRADGFDEHELWAISDPNTFMQAKHPSQFCGLLLVLYTGARLHEIACLDLSDFGEKKGIRCLSICYIPRAKPYTIEHTCNPQSAKRTWHLESRGLVPLHADLYETGIETYIEDLRELGATSFFPAFRLDAKGKRERRLSHDRNEYLKLVGVHVDCDNVIHCFRDTVCGMLIVDNMDDVRADQWTGHKNQSRGAISGAAKQRSNCK